MSTEPHGVPDEATQSRIAPMGDAMPERLGPRAIAFILLMALAALGIGWLVSGR